jgi:hypothetical protein
MKGTFVDRDELARAVTIVEERVTANGETFLGGTAVQKSRDAVLVTCQVEGYPGDRQAVVTLEELSE